MMRSAVTRPDKRKFRAILKLIRLFSFNSNGIRWVLFQMGLLKTPLVP